MMKRQKKKNTPECKHGFQTGSLTEKDNMKVSKKHI